MPDAGRGHGGSQELATGSLVRDTYLVVRCVGRGGMGDVYEVEHSRLAGRYALKVLRGDLSRVPEVLDRFRREAEIVSGLRHPHIVQVIDFNTTPAGAPYLVMEFLDGPDLKSSLRQFGPMPVERVATIVKQVAAALSAAHGQEIVHRDLKPENILLVKFQGQGGDFAKIVDFGISKIQSATTRLTDLHTVLGTPHYMSPEQARGQNQHIDGRTDQFALAAIVYEMLSGEVAFQGDDVSAIIYQVVHETPSRLAAGAVLVSADIAAVLRKALAKDPAERYPTIGEFAEAFASAAADVAGAGVGEVVAVRGHRKVWLAVAAVTVAAGATLVALRRQSPSGPHATVDTGALTGLPPPPPASPPPLPTPPPAAAASPEPPQAPAAAPARPHAKARAPSKAPAIRPYDDL